MTAKEKVQAAVEAGIIDPVRCPPLVKNPDKWLKIARVPVDALCTPGKDSIPEALRTLLESYHIDREAGCRGILLGGSVDLGLAQAIAAGFMRNLVDARVYNLAEVIYLEQDYSLPEPSVLVIPDLFDPATSIAKWEIKYIHAALARRNFAAKWTIGMTTDLKAALAAYGQSFEGITKTWRRVKL